MKSARDEEAGKKLPTQDADLTAASLEPVKSISARLADGIEVK